MKNQFRNYFILSFFAILFVVVACKKDEALTPAKSSDKSMSSFAFSSLTPAVSATITGTTVAAMVPFNVDVTSLAPTISVAAKTTVSPASGSTQNFTNAVTYTVTAEDGTTAAYSVTVTKGVAPKSSAKDITKFSFAALSPVVDATIDAANKTISATLPAGTKVTALVPTITISDKATVSPATGVATDFTKEVSYTVTAEDLSLQVWKVNVTVDVPDVLNDILLFAGNDRNLYAFDAETGAKKWSYTLLSYGSTPSVVNDIVYVGDNFGYLYALDLKTGAKKWSNKLGSSFTDAPTVVDGVIYANTNQYSPSYKSSIVAVNATNGNLIWQYDVPENGKQNSIGASPTVGNGIICFSSYNYNWYALDAKTGTVKWTFAEKSYSYTSPAYVGSTIYIGGSDAIYAKDMITGTTKWTIPNKTSARGLTVSDGLLYGNTNITGNFSVSAFDVSNGALKWESVLASTGSALSTVFKLGKIVFL